VIPVQPQPEPNSFDQKVRKPGQAWLNKNSFPLDRPLPKKSKPEPFWTECLDDLYYGYNGICAYLAIYIEKATGAVSADHFVAKSTSKACLIYEWGNYRLACLRMNTLKNKFDDVLDPFTMADNVFHLELISGHIYVNPAIAITDKKLFDEAKNTRDRLRLDNGENCEMRRKHFEYYVTGRISEYHLRETSPFVWREAQRQNLL
jgi:hypothetical protein